MGRISSGKGSWYCTLSFALLLYVGASFAAVPVSNVTSDVLSPKKEGESTNLTCRANGSSPITYTLHKVGGVTSGYRWSNASGVFTLGNIQRADAGEYRCTADNEAKRSQTSNAVTLEVYYAPRSLSLTSSPSDLTQQENSQVTLTCTADGGHPAPDVTIYRHAVSKTSGNSTATLTITLTKSDNQVALVCNATGAGIRGQMSSNEIKYNVQFHPSGANITQLPTSGVDVNTDVTLTCKTTSSSNPPVSLGWTRDGSTVTDGVTPGTEAGEHNAKVSTSQLRFRAQKQNNGNVYVCRATTMTHLTDQTTLNVTFEPDHVTLSESPPGPVRFGTTKSMTCSTDSANPAAQITWTRDGVTASDDVKAETSDGLYKAFTVKSTITIHTTRDHNQNVYKCHVKHMEQDLPGLAQSLSLNITYAPSNLSLTSWPSELTQQENSQVTLTCTADGGHPVPDVTIYRHGVSKASGQSAATLTITLTKSDNQVALVCKATSAGITGQMSSNEIKYNVQFPYRVSVSASRNPVREGSHTTLTCHPSGGNPQRVTSYEWSGPSPIATTSTVIGSKRQLTLNNVTYLHAGRYYCAVANMGGIGSGHRDLDVLYLAKLNPRVTHTDLITAEYRQTVTFTLKVIANPLPTYTWSRVYHGKETPLLTKSVVRSSGLTSNLTIPTTTKHDAATYMCRVSNVVGLKLFMFKLNIAASPELPSHPGILYVSAVSVTLQWTAGFNGGFRQTFSVMYRVVGHAWPQEPQITRIQDPGENEKVQEKVANLEQSTAYEFRVRADNERTDGERRGQFTISIKANTKAKPIIDGDTLTVVRAPESTSASVSWSEPRGQFTDIRVRVCEISAGRCTSHPVNTSQSRTQTHVRHLDSDKKYLYTLQLYDNADLVYASGQVTSSAPAIIPVAHTQPAVGALAGFLAVSIVLNMALTIALVIVLRRRNPDKANRCPCPALQCCSKETFECSRLSVCVRSDKTKNSDESIDQHIDQHTYANTSFTQDLSSKAADKENSGVIYENMHIMNANVQKKNNHIEAKDKFKSRDTTRDFAAGAAPHVFTDVIAELRGSNTNDYEQLRRKPGPISPTEETYSQLQPTSPHRR